jgi:hypothetical protein
MSSDRGINTESNVITEAGISVISVGGVCPLAGACERGGCSTVVLDWGQS